jgi:tRNA(fMet)-specific endonuclease VapC
MQAVSCPHACIGEIETVAVVRSASAIVLPVPVLAEIRVGFARATRGQKNEATLARFLDASRVRVLSCDEQTTYFYAQLKLQLTKQGTPIPMGDVWIAALVIQHGLALHTLDSDFDNLPQLARV